MARIQISLISLCPLTRNEEEIFACSLKVAFSNQMAKLCQKTLPFWKSLIYSSANSLVNSASLSNKAIFPLPVLFLLGYLIFKQSLYFSQWADLSGQGGQFSTKPWFVTLHYSSSLGAFRCFSNRRTWKLKMTEDFKRMFGSK